MTDTTPEIALRHLVLVIAGPGRGRACVSAQEILDNISKFAPILAQLAGGQYAPPGAPVPGVAVRWEYSHPQIIEWHDCTKVRAETMQGKGCIVRALGVIEPAPEGMVLVPATLLNRTRSELQDIVEWTYVEKAPLRKLELDHIKETIAMLAAHAVTATTAKDQT